jgi:hypothetical protein
MNGKTPREQAKEVTLRQILSPHSFIESRLAISRRIFDQPYVCKTIEHELNRDDSEQQSH